MTTSGPAGSNRPTGPGSSSAGSDSSSDGAAGVLGNAGIEELRRTLPLVPGRAVDVLREDVRAAADR